MSRLIKGFFISNGNYNYCDAEADLIAFLEMF